LRKRLNKRKLTRPRRPKLFEKAQKIKDVPPSTLPPPTLGPSIPLPMRDAQIAYQVEVSVENTIWRNG